MDKCKRMIHNWKCKENWVNFNNDQDEEIFWKVRKKDKKNKQNEWDRKDECQGKKTRGRKRKEYK